MKLLLWQVDSFIQGFAGKPTPGKSLPLYFGESRRKIHFYLFLNILFFLFFFGGGAKKIGEQLC
jgi:hypothetical protein